jgi:hypothetical protein
LRIALRQVFGDLAHQIDGAVAGNQAADVLVVGVVKGARNLARGQGRILKQGTARGGYRRGCGKVLDNRRWVQAISLLVLLSPLLLSLPLLFSLFRDGQALA